MIHWAIVNMNGELEGQFSVIGASSNKKKFEQIQPPEGYTKVLLTFEEYQGLSEDYDRENRIYNRKVDLIEGKPVMMTAEEKQAVLDKRPEWYQDRKQPDGRIKRVRKDGSEMEVKPDGTEIEWRETLTETTPRT